MKICQYSSAVDLALDVIRCVMWAPQWTYMASGWIFLVGAHSSYFFLGEHSSDFAACFATASAKAFPFETTSLCFVCAQHFTTAICFGKWIASNSSAINLPFLTGVPDVVYPLTFQSAPMSCATPYAYWESVYMITLLSSGKLHAAISAHSSACCVE